MKIAIAVKSAIPVSRYGGTQRVVCSLGKALAAMGHDVTFLAAPGSRNPGYGSLKVLDPSLSLEAQIPEEADILHLHDIVPPPGLKKPYAVTYHGNGMALPLDRNAIFVSADHARRFGCQAFVHNGLDWDEYPAADLTLPRRGYHFLGKGAWKVKNLRGCIRLARNAGKPLEVMGARRLNFKMGFRLTLSPSVHFRGMADNAAKAAIASRSEGLLFPVLWDEPFGLAVIESLYYGAPVYATPHGSLPELVTPETGVLAEDFISMAEALREGRPFSPKVCHDYARTLFSAEAMARGYLEKYERVLAGEALNSCASDEDGSLPLGGRRYPF